MTIHKIFSGTINILLLTLFSMQASSQNTPGNYDLLWKNVDTLIGKRLTASALTEIDRIYRKSKKENIQPQIIKSLLYKNRLVNQIQEEGTKKMIDTFQLEIKSSKGVEKAILQSITAGLYQNYFNYNRYGFYSTTNTENFRKEDIATWTASDFKNKIRELYLASLEYPQLRTISLKPFEAIIDPGNVPELRPTLFDLLAHRALDYFKSAGNDIERPSFVFEIDNPDAFAPAEIFATIKFQSKDSTSLHLNALRIFQELIQFHRNDPKPLLDVNLERLQFVYSYAVIPEKDSLYENSLNEIYSTVKDPQSAEAGYLLAQQFYQEATENNNAGKMKETVRLLENIIRQFPNSRAGKESKNLLQVIKSPALTLQTEKVNVPGKPFRTLVGFKNVDRIYLRIVKATRNQRRDINNSLYPMEKGFGKILALPVVKSWTQNMPEINDYLTHSVEIKTEALPVGEYYLIASHSKDFSTGDNVMAAQILFISNLSFVQNGLNYFVLDRTSGKPIASAIVNVWNNSYDYKTRKNILTKEYTLRSDKNGFFKVKSNAIQRNITLEISTKNDHLFLDDNQYLYSYNSNETDEYEDQQEYDEEHARIFLFTDRSLYRPGQTVYFKGIGVTKNFRTKKSQLLKTAGPVKFYLSNANGENIDSLSLELNEYGSCHGTFKLPENQLTGTFRIESEDFDQSSVHFNVEEYKRPKYFAEFEKAKESYKVNDTISVTGKATAFAGNVIDGAQVKYTVRRVARFLYPWYFWRKGLPAIQPLEITHGETITDENGKFTVSFPAIPDKSLDPKTDPVFDFQVSADITDINGETHSTEITVPVGYKALDLQIEIANKSIFFKDNLQQMTITAKNLSGESQKIMADLRIYKLQSPGRFMRERLWPEPDTTVMTKETFLSLFPYDVYRNENRQETWAKKELVFSKSDSVDGSGNIGVTIPLDEGWYATEVTSPDRYGNEVKDIKYFQIVNPDSKTPSAEDNYFKSPQIKNYKPGETATLYAGFGDDVHLIQEVERVKEDNYYSEYSFYDINHSVKKLSYPIAESDRGGFGVMLFYVKHNRFYSQKAIVNVPWSNKKLDITFDTYRDKTLPGSKETWKLTVKGEEGNKISAEMLASMYDASLDQILPHQWQPMNLWPYYASYDNWQGRNNFSAMSSFNLLTNPKLIPVNQKTYAALKFIDYFRNDMIYGSRNMMKKEAFQEVVVTARGMGNVAAAPVTDSTRISSDLPERSSSEQKENSQADQPARTNFNETAFFYPDLFTDKDGNVSFSFTIPEALTRWKLMTLAHTKDLATGYAEKSVVTQKNLMVMPNAPRFFREGDKIRFSAKVVNMTGEAISGNVKFHLLNASTMNPVDGWFQNTDTLQSFSVPGMQSTVVFFDLDIPKGFNDVVVYRIVARAGNHSDGEENYIPVVTNRTLVTESMPLNLKGNGTKNFSFDKLLKSGKSNTLSNFGLTVEYTTNPAWYAVQALPYLNNYPYLCTEQVFNRYFANAVALHIANSSPRIKSVFEKWRTEDTSALLSNLQKNQELKSVLLQETPWVMQAKSEAEQKKNIAFLFDLVKMNSQLSSALQIVKDRQTSNGGFSWFNGGPDDRFITQYLLSDIGHLRKLNAWPEKDKALLETIAQKAVAYMDARIIEDYHLLKKSKIGEMKNMAPLEVQYLYARSFFPEIKIDDKTRTAFNYYFDRAMKYWTNQSIYMQGMTALVMYRNDEKQVASDIVKSLKENAITHEEMGMYWKAWNQRGYWWYQAPVESQALMIEVFTEVAKDANAVADLKTWLLKNKQTNEWSSTKATTESVYALLLQGNIWIYADRNVKIKLGNTVLDSKNEKQEAGTGYFKRSIDGQNVKPEMGNISVSVSSPEKNQTPSPSWGAVYWQYFEDLDKISPAETPLRLSKRLFTEKNTDRGPVLTPVNEGDTLRVGDKIKVRIELRVDRDMEYVHMKDMRASCMEPVNVLSGYKWQGGLGYYESTLDVSTNFFFNYLPKGTYVFEYPMFVTHSGDFSNGITSIQCMYAPEFSAHSEGVRVKVN